MQPLDSFTVKIFADGADLAGIRDLAGCSFIRGFTTNPTLMHKAGVRDYRQFAHEALQIVNGRPISFEVFSDEFDEMERQAIEIAGWGPNVYVKIPVTNTRGLPAFDLIARLSQRGVQLNVTAVLTLAQVNAIVTRLVDGIPSCISVFAGRIADTGRDPVPIVKAAVEIVRHSPRTEVIWASPRELLNIRHADEAGCHIITVTTDILKKLPLLGRSLDEYSLDTVKMFYDDACRAGFTL
jgi:transaldolase